MTDNLDRITAELKKESGRPERINRKRLIDALHLLNFQEQPIVMNFRQVQSGRTLSLRALPEPCLSETLTCSWTEPPPAGIETEYRCYSFFVDRGDSLLVVKAEVKEINERVLHLGLPEYCQVIYPRKVRRYTSDKIFAIVSHDGEIFQGTLKDFSTVSFRVLLSAEPPQRFNSIDPSGRVWLTLRSSDETVYEGESKVVRQADSGGEREFVLAPVENGDDPYILDGLDMPGYVLTPRPDVLFEHPFTKKITAFELDEISHSWFSIVEFHNKSSLFSGLVIPRAEIRILTGFSVRCKAKVESGSVSQNNGKNIVRWRLVVSDVSEEDQAKLFGLLQKVADQRSNQPGKVDLSDVISFFFDAGFVYPKKYLALQPYKSQFTETYRKLYVESPAIARRFIQQDKGVILGHISMVRFYENAWLIHHHAAIGQHGAGIAVLSQITEHIKKYRGFYFSHMGFLMCYFRPDNRFPQRIFGGFTRFLNSPKVCSIDAFAYVTLHFRDRGSPEPDALWALVPANREDLAALKEYYEHTSGGLMIKAMDLEPDLIDADTRSREYERLGFKRQKHTMSLKKEGVLKAIVVVTVSDIGLNMSNLTNCIHVLLAGNSGSGDVPFEQLRRELLSLSPNYIEDEVPLLLYPSTYMENQAESYEKVYDLMILDSAYIEHFEEYMKRLFFRKAGGNKVVDLPAKNRSGC
jgi:hypothetical protein